MHNNIHKENRFQADFKAKVAMPMGSKKSLDQSNGPADKTKVISCILINCFDLYSYYY